LESQITKDFSNSGLHQNLQQRQNIKVSCKKKLKKCCKKIFRTPKKVQDLRRHNQVRDFGGSGGLGGTFKQDQKFDHKFKTSKHLQS